jgi:hypothetical protein
LAWLDAHGQRVSSLSQLESRLDALTTRILPPLRATKYVDRDGFAQLSELVRDIIAAVDDSPGISRELAGKLWFVLTQALSEAEHCEFREEIPRFAWSYEDALHRLSGPWFSSSDPTPGQPRY